MPTYASVTDVETELGRPSASSAETAQWNAWLGRVERAIERRFARVGLVLAEQIADENPSEQDVIDVEVAAVIRKILNPTGLTSTTVSVDDGSVTRRQDVPDGGLLLTDDEWELLLPEVQSAAFSTRPGFEPDSITAESWE